MMPANIEVDEPVKPEDNNSSPLRGSWTAVRGHPMFARVFAAPDESDDIPKNVIMVHGLGISSIYMVPAAERLASYFSVHAPDLPGFGRSARPPHVLDIEEMASALQEWMNAHGLKTAHFVGNSIGCQVIAHLAVKHPGCVRKVVFVGPTFDRASRFVVPLLMRALSDSRWEPRSLSRLVVRDYLSAGPVRLVKTLLYALQDPIEQLLPQIAATTLVVRGEHDAVVPQGWAGRVTRLIPRAHLRVIRGASHAVHYSHPERFVRAVLPFLQGVDYD